MSTFARRAVGVFGAVAVAASIVAAPAYAAAATIDSFEPGVSRLAGDTRYETAIRVAQKFQPNVSAVFVATGEQFPDALSAAAAAAQIGGPLLLTQPDELPAGVAAEIRRLNPAEIIIVGGEQAVSVEVESQLRELVGNTGRIAGGDRYATSIQLADSSFDTAGTAFLATGATFPDALSASGAAGVQQAPVLLVNGAEALVDETVLGLLKGLGVSSVQLVGGTSTISTGIEQQLTTAGLAVSRHGGEDRYETSALINAANFSAASTSLGFFATGVTFPDALAGAALAGQADAPLFVTRFECLPEKTSNVAAALGLDSRILLGGPSTLTDASATTTCQPAPVETPGTTAPDPTPSAPVYVADHKTPGAYCPSEDAGKHAYSSKGVELACTRTADDDRLRWRAV